MKIEIVDFGKNYTFWGAKGDTGLSAYQLALQNGFIGSLDEWLNSLSNYWIRNTLLDRNTIPDFFRKNGLKCFVIEEETTYQLVDGIEDSNWRQTSMRVEFADTFAQISSSNKKRDIVVQSSERNGEKPTRYWHDGNSVQWIPSVTITIN